MQGFNMGRYYTPDASGRPTFNNSAHPLGKRASKISQGILTVRFELPFAVWCSHCSPPAIIGQGVRFNAEKKKVGNYHSTPIWSFRMKHSACGGWWEIRTDPKSAEYIVVDGAKRRDYGADGDTGEIDGDLKFLTEKEKEERRNDAFANLEGKIEDQSTSLKSKERLDDLYDQSEVWRDPYDVNAKLRENFRQKRKLWARDYRQKEGIRDKFSLGIDIADESDADGAHAGLVEFGDNTATQISADNKWKPLFENDVPSTAVEQHLNTKKPKLDVSTDDNRRSLQQTLVSNTKATIDPFMSTGEKSNLKTGFNIPRIKRSIIKGAELPSTSSKARAHQESNDLIKHSGSTLALVNYDSD